MIAAIRGAVDDFFKDNDSAGLAKKPQVEELLKGLLDKGPIQSAAKQVQRLQQSVPPNLIDLTAKFKPINELTELLHLSVESLESFSLNLSQAIIRAANS